MQQKMLRQKTRTAMTMPAMAGHLVIGLARIKEGGLIGVYILAVGFGHTIAPA